MSINEKTISIIVPIYKVEEYLDKCVESLIKQTYGNIEIILVDDGSPDKCPQMCDEYAKKDPRVKVIHKINGGLSDARNFGLREAKGEYVLFVDSDDYIELDTCDKFIEVIGNRKPDLIVGNAKRIENTKVLDMKHTFNNINEIITGQSYLKQELAAGTMHMAVWLTLYNRNFLVKNNLEFKVGLLHEDEQFTPRVFLKADKVIGSDIVFYNYLIRENSITTGKNKVKNAEHIIATCYELETIYNQLSNKDLKVLLMDNLVNKYLNIFQEAKLYKREYMYLINKKFLIDKAYSGKNKIKVFIFMLNKKAYFYINNFTKRLN